jgi:CHAT domain-containing protein/Flp pilus assembly protein TadD
MRSVGRCCAIVVVVCLFTIGSRVAAQTAPQTIEDAERLLQQAGELERTGKYRDGIPIAERATALFESLLGPTDPRVANASMALGALHFRAGNYSAAATAFGRALAIREKAPGTDPLAIAASLSALANAKRGTGQLVEAEELFARSLMIQEKALGSDHIEVARTLISYGSLLDARGDSGGAESMLRRALGVFESNQATDTMEFAALLNNLGGLYRRAGSLDKAREPLERSVAIREKLLGSQSPMHPQLASGLASLAALYQEMGQFDLAEPLHRRVLAAYEASLGPSHPNVATVLTNLAMIRTLRDDPTEAESLFLRALQIRETTLGPRHADVASTLEKLAVFYQVAGRPLDALNALERSTDILEQNLQLVLASGSEQQRLNYMATVRENTDIALSMRQAILASDDRAAAVVASLVLRRKGRVLDAMVTVTERLRNRLTADDRRLLDQLAEARSQLAGLVLQPAAAQPKDRDEKTRALESEIARLESALSARSREAQVEMRPVDAAVVQRQLPANTRLVEYVRYRPFLPRVIGQANRFGPPRYAAFVLRPTGPPRWIEIGDGEVIDRHISAFRAALRSPARTDVRQRSRDLARLILDPIGADLDGLARLVISPDGELSVIPFAALVDDKGRYLVERCEIDGLASGRDLLRLSDRLAPRESPLIVADPAFQAETPGTPGGGGLVFEALPGTAEEASALKALLPDARIATKAAATETLVKGVKGPRLLHIATHGFFFDPASLAAASTPSDRRGPSPAAAPAESAGRFALLRSGLALAGANGARAGEKDDGLLTAFEVASLDLHGTQLVVLSACETGLGEVRSGDGVYGLGRALTLAGAETQVMSLWQVSDEATRDLMIGFYRKLIAHEGRVAAMRAVQLEWLRKGPRSHPFFWAAFVVSGDWSPMRAI